MAIRATAHHHCASVNGSSYDCRVHRVEGGDDDDNSRPHHYPVYVDGVCRRVVDAIEYRVTHNGTGGARELDVHFYHRDVTDPGRPVHVGQTFSARFGWAAAAAVGAREPYARSGKPGYATGSPVLVTSGAGRRPRPMDLPEPDAYGACDRADLTTGRHRPRRRPVNFLENVEVRCRVAVPSPRPRQRSARADESAGGVTFADFCHRVQNEVSVTPFSSSILSPNPKRHAPCSPAVFTNWTQRARAGAHHRRADVINVRPLRYDPFSLVARLSRRFAGRTRLATRLVRSRTRCELLQSEKYNCTITYSSRTWTLYSVKRIRLCTTHVYGMVFYRSRDVSETTRPAVHREFSKLSTISRRKLSSDVPEIELVLTCLCARSMILLIVN